MSTRAALHFTVTDEGVRFGLAAIKNVGEAAIASILESREQHGRITSLNRLCERGRPAAGQPARA